MPFFPYDTISEFFEAEGDFLENLDFEEQDLRAVEDDLHPCCVHCNHVGDLNTHLSACSECEEGRGLFERAEVPARPSLVVTYRRKRGNGAFLYTITRHQEGCRTLRAETTTYPYDAAHHQGATDCKACKPGEVQAEDEQAHWEEDPAYRALYGA